MTTSTCCGPRDMGCCCSKVDDAGKVMAQFFKIVGFLKKGEALYQNAATQTEPHEASAAIDRIMGYNDAIFSNAGSGPCQHCGKDKQEHLGDLSFCGAAANEV